jgi:hypothetical protein
MHPHDDSQEGEGGDGEQLGTHGVVWKIGCSGGKGRSFPADPVDVSLRMEPQKTSLGKPSDERDGRSTPTAAGVRLVNSSPARRKP